jgi:YggT family protein
VGDIVAYIARIISGIISVYMLLLCVRLILSWFAGADFGGPMIFLRSVCDPYLNWWRRFRIFKKSPLDFSPILALAFLSLVRGIFGEWSRWGTISLGIILALIVSSLWSLVSMILGFLIIILILRFIAFLGNFNTYSPFWRFIDFIAQPIMFRICRILFPSRIISYAARIIVSLVVLILITAALWTAVSFGIRFLQTLPV